MSPQKKSLNKNLILFFFFSPADKKRKFGNEIHKPRKIANKIEEISPVHEFNTSVCDSQENDSMKESKVSKKCLVRKPSFEKYIFSPKFQDIDLDVQEMKVEEESLVNLLSDEKFDDFDLSTGNFDPLPGIIIEDSEDQTTADPSVQDFCP